VRSDREVSLVVIDNVDDDVDGDVVITRLWSCAPVYEPLDDALSSSLSALTWRLHAGLSAYFHHVRSRVGEAD
jgi:hypothetical protein